MLQSKAPALMNNRKVTGNDLLRRKLQKSVQPQAPAKNGAVNSGLQMKAQSQVLSKSLNNSQRNAQRQTQASRKLGVVQQRAQILNTNQRPVRKK